MKKRSPKKKADKHFFILTHFAASSVAEKKVGECLARFRPFLKSHKICSNCEILDAVFISRDFHWDILLTNHERDNVIKRDRIARSRKIVNLSHDKKHPLRSPAVVFLEADILNCLKV